jgi:hypothetical protein
MNKSRNGRSRRLSQRWIAVTAAVGAVAVGIAVPAPAYACGMSSKSRGWSTSSWGWDFFGSQGAEESQPKPVVES